MPISGISVSAMRRGIYSLRLRQSAKATVSGLLGHLASHGPGTTGRAKGAMQIAQAILVNIAVRTLGPGARLNSSCHKDTNILTVIAMAKLANRLGDASTSWPSTCEVVSKYHQRSCSPHCKGAVAVMRLRPHRSTSTKEEAAPPSWKRRPSSLVYALQST